MTASPGIDRVSRLVGRVVSLRQGDGAIALLMFAYSFLAMASYNILKPLTRSRFISDLGSDKLPYVLLASGVVIAVLMHWYSNGGGASAAPARDSGHTGGHHRAARRLFAAAADGRRVGDRRLLRVRPDPRRAPHQPVLDLANDVYDARQAKRLFGFIGAGASLGGVAGAAVVVTSSSTRSASTASCW